jgi:hypothetical protein
MGLPLYVIHFFSLTAFSILSLLSVLVVLMICHGKDLLWSSLFGVLEASLSFKRFFCKAVKINILDYPLLSPLIKVV